MSDADTTAWRRRAERCDDRVRELREEMARRDEQIAAVRALLVPTPMEACDRDCGWCGDTCDRVAEMREYVYVEQIKAALDGAS